MMALRTPTRKRSAEAALLPMINVVFLLLIFFLIAAKLTPPEAFAVTPPTVRPSPGPVADGDLVLLLGADGRLGFGPLTGDEALASLALARADWCASVDCVSAPPALTIRADAAAPARALAALLPRLARIGFARIDLAAVPE